MFRNLSDPLTSLYSDGEASARITVDGSNTVKHSLSNASSENEVFVLLPSATIQDATSFVWRGPTGAGVVMGNYAGNRLTFGVCVSGPETSGNTLYEYSMATYSGHFGTPLVDNISLQPFIGQLASSTAVEWKGNTLETQSRQNESGYHMLPCQHKQHILVISAQGRVLVGKNLAAVRRTVNVGNPIVFGVIIRSDVAFATFRDLDISISAQKLTEPTEINGNFTGSNLL